MRLWSLHPSYLDTRGLTALWREALLAQKVLKGETRGYRSHPQLLRFKEQSDPAAAIAAYLEVVWEEACRRSFHFDRFKICSVDGAQTAEWTGAIPVTRGQLLYEWEHLKNKLRQRDPARFAQLERLSPPALHPLFIVIEGQIASWEKNEGKNYG
jgi:hypothetical protein